MEQRTYSERRSDGSRAYYALVYLRGPQCYWLRGPYASRATARRVAIKESEPA